MLNFVTQIFSSYFGSDQGFNHPNFLVDVEIENVNLSDYPDFVDAFVSYAWNDYLERELTDQELDDLNDNFPEFVHELIFAKHLS